MVILTLLRIRTDRQWKECRRLWLSACNRYDSRVQLASYDHVSSTMERNVLWVRISRTTGHLSRRTITYHRRWREICYGCGCLARRAHLRIFRRTLCSREWSVSSRIEDAGLVADVSMQDSQSKGGRKRLILASYDHVSSTMESNVLWVRVSRTTGGSLVSYDHVSSTILYYCNYCNDCNDCNYCNYYNYCND